MEVHFVAPDLRHLDGLKCEALALPFFEDVRPLRGAVGLVDWRLCGQISRLLLRGRASGAWKDVLLLPTRPRLPFEKLFLFGAGPIEELDDARFVDVIDRMLTTLGQARVRASVVGLPGRCMGRIDPERAMAMFLELAARYPEQDQVTLIEDPEAQRAMAPVVDRERRRVLATVE